MPPDNPLASWVAGRARPKRCSEVALRPGPGSEEGSSPPEPQCLRAAARAWRLALGPPCRRAPSPGPPAPGPGAGRFCTSPLTSASELRGHRGRAGRRQEALRRSGRPGPRHPLPLGAHGWSPASLHGLRASPLNPLPPVGTGSGRDGLSPDAARAPQPQVSPLQRLRGPQALQS